MCLGKRCQWVVGGGYPKLTHVFGDSCVNLKAIKAYQMEEAKKRGVFVGGGIVKSLDPVPIVSAEAL